MLRSKAFMKVTKKGNVVKVVKEHYLRDDIHCGMDCEFCLPCEQQPLTISDIIIPDTNIFIHQMDIMEHEMIKNVVVLQTVIDELKGHAISLYERLRKIIANEDKSFFVFSNEHHKETFIERENEETVNDRNDRAIRKAAFWYSRHLSQLEISKMKDSSYKVIFLSDDFDNRQKAKELGLFSISTIEFLEKYNPDLLDMMNLPEPEQKEEFKYPDFISESIIKAAPMGKYFKSTLNVSNFNCFEGSVYCEYFGEMTGIAISGRLNMNRAVHGDVVYVEVLPQEEWASEEVAAKDESEGVEEQTEIIKEAKQSEEACKKVCAKVVAIEKRNWRAYCGTIDKKTIRSGTGIQYVLVSPMDRRIPKIRIRTRQAHQLATQRIIISIDSWDSQSKYPFGHYVKNLGLAGTKATESEALLLEHDVPYTPFSKQVLSCLPSEEWKPSEQDYQIRRDFRELNVCSIDPPGCTDIDDALHVVLLENGNYQVGVHIADVTHFVKPLTAMDSEASKRGTTVYLVDRRIDMLPALLGTNLCSLKSDVERFAFSAVWEMTEDAVIINEWFGKSVIKSKASLTYDEAQKRIDNPDLMDPISHNVRLLNVLAKKLRAKRMESGALTLASPEVRFQLENDSQDPVDVEMKELREANALVEEFMLLANIQVARKIYKHFPDIALLRRHPIPPPDNFLLLQEALKTKNLEIDISSSKALADSLDKCVTEEDSYFNKLVRIMTTRCMMQAVYFCSGSVSPTEFVHYGLATPIYTHFTSPIRRYSDVVVHRLLDASINNSSEMELSKQKMMELTDNLNYRHRMAQQAGRSSVELFTCLFFKGKSVEEDAYVFRILKNGLVVFIPKYGIEGVVYLDDYLDLLTHSQFEFKKENKPFLSIFQPIKVQISMGDEIDLSRRKVLTSLISPELPLLKKRKTEEK